MPGLPQPPSNAAAAAQHRPWHHDLLRSAHMTPMAQQGKARCSQMRSRVVQMRSLRSAATMLPAHLELALAAGALLLRVLLLAASAMAALRRRRSASSRQMLPDKGTVATQAAVQTSFPA